MSQHASFDRPFTLRLATDDEVPALVALAVEIFGPFMSAYNAYVGPVIFRHERTDWEGEYRRTMPGLVGADPDQPGRATILAESSGRIVGFVAWHHDEERRHGDLTLVAVSAEARRTGIGTALCQHALDDLRARGAEVVDVGTGGDDFHAGARVLYESLGFQAVVVMHYVRELQDTP